MGGEGEGRREWGQEEEVTACAAATLVMSPLYKGVGQGSRVVVVAVVEGLEWVRGEGRRESEDVVVGTLVFQPIFLINIL